MHRSIEASIPCANTEAITKDLLLNPNVVGLNVLRNASLKPPGDTLLIHVLNRGADDVLRTVCDHVPDGAFSIITSEIASISDPKNQKRIDKDIDEAIWEEMETGLRHNGRPTMNYLILMAIGGIIAAIGLVSPTHHQVIAFVAASIIAPGLEPLAKLPLGIVLKSWDVVWVGLKATVIGYAVLAISAALVFKLLLMLGEVHISDFVNNPATESFRHFKIPNMIVSLAAAAASILMYLAYRRNVIAGPLVALILIPASSAVGMSLAIGDWQQALQIAKIFSADVVMVVGAGLILIYLKQKFVHKRMPLR